MASDTNFSNTKICSMTGYGRYSESLPAADLQLECEIRSLNSRYLDLNLKLPRCLSEYEYQIRSLFSSRVSRGKVECSISLKQINGSGIKDLHLSALREKLEQTSVVFNAVSVAFSDSDKALIINRYLNENTNELIIEATIFESIKVAIEKAILNFTSHRQSEAQFLLSDINSRIEVIRQIKSEIVQNLKEQPLIFEDKLKNRIEKLTNNKLEFDQDRFAQELAYLVDRADVSEELVRLDAHLSTFVSSVLQSDNKTVSVGKKLDFLCQEIFRELNTLGNKASNALIQTKVVDAKLELEKIREQVQNLE